MKVTEGVLLEVDGTSRKVKFKDSYYPTCKKLIGGWLELVRTIDNRTLVVDEEGLIKNLPINNQASLLYRGGRIVGRAILLQVSKEELRD